MKPMRCRPCFVSSAAHRAAPHRPLSGSPAMTLTQLRYLVAIADSGLNITLAAERVHATQPGLSKQLKQLEDELGFQLFTRKGRSLEAIAPAGERVLMHARRILEEASNIRAYAANERGQHSGRLVLATTHTQARFVLPEVIAAVKREFPQVSVHLQAAADGEVLEQLARGEADLAVISTAGGEPEGGVAVPLYRWRRVVLVPLDASAGQARSRADAGGTGGASADQLRIVDQAGVLAAPHLRRCRPGAAAGDDRARCRPDQDLRARRPGRRRAGGDGGRRARYRPQGVAGAGRVARVHHLGGDPARAGAARVRVGADARHRAAARPPRPAPRAGRQPGAALAAGAESGAS